MYSRVIHVQILLSMGFRRQEYWNALPFPTPGHLPDPGIEPLSPALQGDSLPLSHQESLSLCILFWIFFSHYRLVQDIEYSSLCYIVGPYYLSILYTVICIFEPQAPCLSIPLFPFGNDKFVFYVYKCFCFVCKFICII